ncbi:MAG: hypothetical protein EOO47_02195 [Flavobacterium sp.]|nr:MAG: hypothetical protein EOO47_02195 [Flavobacterium sp.]
MKRFFLAIILLSFGCTAKKQYAEAQNGKTLNGTVVQTYQTTYRNMSLNWIVLNDSSKVVIQNGKYEPGSSYKGKVKKLIL